MPDNLEGQASGGPVLRVVVVDDNRDFADSLCVLLQMWGHEARVAYDGVAGLEIARAWQPDCLLLDIGMPRLDGYALAKQVRQEPGLAQAKLIAMTAYSGEDHARRAREAGFDLHLIKAADPAELEKALASLREVVRLAHQGEQLARKNVTLAGEARGLVRELKQEVRDAKEEGKGPPPAAE